MQSPEPAKSPLTRADFLPGLETLHFTSHATSAHLFLCYFYLYSTMAADPFSWVLDKPTEIQPLTKNLLISDGFI